MFKAMSDDTLSTRIITAYINLLDATGTWRSHRYEIIWNMEQRPTSRLWRCTGEGDLFARKI